jgi:hypothetical protein
MWKNKKKLTQRHEKQYSISDKPSSYWHELNKRGMVKMKKNPKKCKRKTQKLFDHPLVQ